MTAISLPELHPPSNLVSWWGRLEPHGLPVGGLDVFKVINIVLIIVAVLLDLILKKTDGVPDEQVCHMLGHEVVHPCICEVFVDILVIEHLVIIVSVPLIAAVGQEGVNGVIPRLGNDKLVVLEWIQTPLLPCSVIHRPSNNIPPENNEEKVSIMTNKEP